MSDGHKPKHNVVEQPKSAGFRLLPKIVNGGVAGIVGVACVFPLDLVKTRLQNQQTSLGVKEYSGIIDAIKKTFRSEGIVGMYRGSLVNIILVTPEKSTKLAANDFFRHHYQTRDGKLPLLREILAGASAGLCAIGITTPMELIKIQMQDAGRVNAQLRKSGKPPIDASFMRVVTNIMKSDGPLGFFKGVSATFYRDFAFAVIYFPLFANLRAAGFTMVDSSGNSQFLVNFVSGAASGIISAVAVTPADVMKTRFQTTTKGQGEKTYSGTLDAISTIMKHEGPKAFFKGGACRAMVIGHLYAIAQVVYYIGIGEYFFGVDSAA